MPHNFSWIVEGQALAPFNFEVLHMPVTMLVCYLIHCGAKADEALAEMRRVRPGSVDTEEQEAAVFAYEERIQ
jgi:hypothetical protein